MIAALLLCACLQRTGPSPSDAYCNNPTVARISASMANSAIPPIRKTIADTTTQLAIFAPDAM